MIAILHGEITQVRVTITTCFNVWINIIMTYGKEIEAMFEFRRCKTDPVTERQFEQMNATIAQQKATIDYLAIMTDVELPEDGEEEQEGEDDE